MVAIVGIGHTKFGQRKDASLRDLMFEAVQKVFNDSGLSPKDIDAMYTAVCGDGFAGQLSPGMLGPDIAGLLHKPNMRVEAACATGSSAIHAAYASIKADLYDRVLVLGAEKMLQVTTPEAIQIMGMAGDLQWESVFGVTFPAYYAMLATAHMAKYGTTEEQLAKVAIKNHHYGAKNPVAQFQKEITLEKALNAAMVAYPLKLFDCCPLTDGAAAVILSKEDIAREDNDTPVYIEGLGSASDHVSLMDRKTLTSLVGAVQAAKTAHNMAKTNIKDIHIACVHDCFTIAEILAYEDLGICERGRGGKFIEEEGSYIGGKLPINVDGGLKSKGHPIGATGVSQAVEIVKQLRGEAEKGRQVPDAERGLVHNVGGSGHYAFVTIYGRR
ncbi:MAG: thiolase domain-containing protein [Promethearchaeota archaeon]